VYLFGRTPQILFAVIDYISNDCFRICTAAATATTASTPRQIAFVENASRQFHDGLRIPCNSHSSIMALDLRKASVEPVRWRGQGVTRKKRPECGRDDGFEPLVGADLMRLLLLQSGGAHGAACSSSRTTTNPSRRRPRHQERADAHSWNGKKEQ